MAYCPDHVRMLGAPRVPRPSRSAGTKTGRIGQGVWRTTVARLQSVLVNDVHEFPGHIACDAASRSELVVPLTRDGAATGVIYVDSPQLSRFAPVDQAGMERVARLYIEASNG